MFVVDTNILVYAANRDCPEHHRCLDLLERSRNQATAWYTTWGVLYGSFAVAGLCFFRSFRAALILKRVARVPLRSTLG